jgi:CRP/FNR family transcriptional regulator
MDSENEFISAFTYFKKAPDRLIAGILQASSKQYISADTIIYNEGDSCSAIAFVFSGLIRVYKSGESGREITLYEIGPGETCILNASCILSNKKYPANAVAVESVDALLIPASRFRELIDSFEQMRDFVFALLSERLASVMTTVEEVAFGRMDERLYDYLVEKSENGILNTTHQKIANDLGSSREVVSRLLKDFERKGKLVLSRNSIKLTL